MKGSGILVIILMLVSCKDWEIPDAYCGSWETDKTNITVRTSPKWMEFEFHKGTGIVSLDIKKDKTVSGSIGLATFENGIVKKNKGNPKITGIACIIQCGSIGKIFPEDPLESKEVEIWVYPATDDGIGGELRYTEGLAVFPMAELKFFHP